jgi:hypothetical protein
MGLTVSHAKSNTIGDFTGTVTVFNSAGTTATALATDLVRPSDWNSAHNITLSVNGTDIFSVGFYEPFDFFAANSTISSLVAGSWNIGPNAVPFAMGSGQINLLMQDGAGFLNGAVYSATSSGSVSRYQTQNMQIALYKLGSGASTTRIESFFTKEISYLATWVRQVSGSTTSNLTVTNALTLSFPSQWDASGGVTYGTTAQSGSTSVGASTGASTLANNLITGAVQYYSGSKFVPFPFNTSIGAGKYWLGLMVNSSTSSTGTNYSTGTMMSTVSVAGMLEFANAAYKRLGQSASNSTSLVTMFDGNYASTSSSPPANIATSDMRNGQGPRIYWNYQQSSY